MIVKESKKWYDNYKNLRFIGKRGITVKKFDDVMNMLQANELLNKELLKKKEEENAGKKFLWIFAIIGGVAAVAMIAYAVYRYMTPDYLEDFDDDFEDDFEDDYFDDEDEAENAKSDVKSEEKKDEE